MIEHIEQGTLPPGRKACIALTSWKKRINTVGLTIFNLMCVCGPEFHIVLTLAEEEFPGKEWELPYDLVLMKKLGLFEILWIKPNYKSFKKVLFAMHKYPMAPIISADDGCIYIDNFAKKLYSIWAAGNRRYIIANKYWGEDEFPGGGGGHGTLYPPNCFGDIGIKTLELYGDKMLRNPNDDRFMAVLSGMMRIQWKYTKDFGCEKCPFINITTEGLSSNNAYIKGDNWKFPKYINLAMQHR